MLENENARLKTETDLLRDERALLKKKFKSCNGNLKAVMSHWHKSLQEVKVHKHLSERLVETKEIDVVIQVEGFKFTAVDRKIVDPGLMIT